MSSTGLLLVVMSNELGDVLRVQRARRRWNQQRAAVALGMTFYRYRQLEVGVEATEDERARIAEVFELSARAVRAASRRSEASA